MLDEYRPTVCGLEYHTSQLLIPRYTQSPSPPPSTQSAQEISPELGTETPESTEALSLHQALDEISLRPETETPESTEALSLHQAFDKISLRLGTEAPESTKALSLHQALNDGRVSLIDQGELKPCYELKETLIISIH